MKGKQNRLFHVIALVFAMTVFGAGSGFALTTTWDGDTDTDWFNAANWDNGVPGSGDVAVFPNLDYKAGDSTPRYCVMGGAVGDCYDITIDATLAPFTLTINGTLWLTGNSIAVTGSAAVTIAGFGFLESITPSGFTIDNQNTNGAGLVITVNTIDIFIGSLSFTGNNSISVSGVISNVPASVTINLTDIGDIVTFSGTNTYHGLTTITKGMLTTSGDERIDDASDVTLAASPDAGLTIGGAEKIHTLTGGAGSTIALGGNTLTVDQDAAATFAGVINGGGGLTLDASSTSKLTLTGNNGFTGAVIIDNGTLNLQHNNAAGTTTGGVTVNNNTGGKLELQGGIIIGAEALTLNGGGTIEFNSVSDDNTWGGALTLATAAVDIKSTAGTLTLSNTNDGGQNMTFDCNNGHITASEVISGDGTLTKTGTGTLKLSGNNSNSGNVTLSAGTLLVNGTNTNAAVGTITVASGATLGGTGTLTCDVLVQTGGIVKPGDPSVASGVGTLAASVGGGGKGKVTFNDGSYLTVNNVDAAKDVLAVATLDFEANNQAYITLESGEHYSQNNAVVTVTTTYDSAEKFRTDSLPAGWSIISTLNSGVTLHYVASTIPTLNELGIIIMLLLLAGASIILMRRKQRSGSVA